jgi:hypothetical protein
MSQVLRTCVEILSRLKPAKLFGNANAFHITQAPTGACFQNLDATRRKSPVAPPSALSQAEPLSWLTLRLTTLLVLSNLPLAASLLPRANKVAFAVLRLAYTKQPPRSFRRCSPVTTPVHHKRVATALPHTMVPPLAHPLLPFPTSGKALGRALRHRAIMSGPSPRTPLGPALRLSPKCLPTSTARMRYGIPSDPAPGHQLVSMHPRRDTQAVSQTAHG